MFKEIEHPLLLGLLALANWPVYREFMRMFFGDLDGFADSLHFWFIPDLISLLRGQYWDDQWAELKLGLWALLCVSTVVSEYKLLTSLLY
jgi:hypothetical protein